MGKIIEAVEIDEAKTYKNMFGGRYSTKKKVGETDFYDVWIAQDVNAGIQIVLLADKNNPKSCVALSWDEVESLPTILKKAMSLISGDSSNASEGTGYKTIAGVRAKVDDKGKIVDEKDKKKIERRLGKPIDEDR